MFPVVDLIQEKAWVPVQKSVHVSLPLIGRQQLPEMTVKWLVYGEVAFGGLVSILTVAYFSGLIRKVRPD